MVFTCSVRNELGASSIQGTLSNPLDYLAVLSMYFSFYLLFFYFRATMAVIKVSSWLCAPGPLLEVIRDMWSQISNWGVLYARPYPLY